MEALATLEVASCILEGKVQDFLAHTGKLKLPWEKGVGDSDEGLIFIISNHK